MLFAQFFPVASWLSPVFAEVPIPGSTSGSGFFPPEFWPGLVSTGVFGLLGIVLVLVAIALFDKVSIARVNLHDELKNGNMAVAAVLSALILGMCYLITHLVR